MKYHYAPLKACRPQALKYPVNYNPDCGFCSLAASKPSLPLLATRAVYPPRSITEETMRWSTHESSITRILIYLCDSLGFKMDKILLNIRTYPNAGTMQCQYFPFILSWINGRKIFNCLRKLYCKRFGFCGLKLFEAPGINFGIDRKDSPLAYQPPEASKPLPQ